MDKKIASIFLLIIVCLSIAVTYSYFYQADTEEKQFDGTGEPFDEDEFGNEIDKIFIEEDDEVEIGDMV